MRKLGYLFILLIVFAGCTPAKSVVIPTRRPAAVYDQFYPNYVELCALSQIRPLGKKTGGTPGHAVMYLKGVCREKEAAYPTIAMCDPKAVDITDENSGVGISVNKDFKNVNWVAIPGKTLFIHGNLKEDQLLNKAHREATIHEAARLGLFRGIKIHKPEKIPKDLNQEEYIASMTIGTDFALKFGRSVFCSRLPITINQMQRIVEYLNDLNRQYANGEADYHWSGYHDNCAHTLHNALANAGVWRAKSVNMFKAQQFAHLAVPANEVAALAVLSNKYSLNSVRKIHRDRIKRQTLLEYEWLPTRHSALMKTVGVHQNNELYDTKFKLFMLQAPLLKFKSRRIQKMLRDERYIDIEKNLLYFKAKYQSISKRRPDLEGREMDEGSFAYTAKHYFDYIDAQLQDVEQKLNQLNRLK